MKILITGATGFVGRNLINKILENKCFEIAILVRDKDKAVHFFGENNHLIYINSESDTFKLEVKKFNPTTVLHLASYLTSDDSQNSINNILNVNIDFGTNLLDSLCDTDVKYFINYGTFAEYFNNDDTLCSPYLYAATKTAFRAIIKYYQQKLNFKWINIVPYTIYGGDDSQKKVIDFIISSIEADEPVKMSKGEQILDFIHIDDVIEFNVNLIDKLPFIKEDYIEFKLGTGKGASIREVATLIENIYQKKTNISWGSLPYRKMDIMQAVANIENNKSILDFETKIDLISGIKKMKHYKENKI